jgi:hypothetical protein
MTDISDEVHLGGDADALPFIVRLDEESGQDTMGLFRRSDGETGVRLVPVEALRQNLAKTATALRKAFDDLGQELGPLHLSEVQVGLEISASGGVHLIGTAGVKAAITLVFRDPREGTE